LCELIISTVSAYNARDKEKEEKRGREREIESNKKKMRRKDMRKKKKKRIRKKNMTKRKKKKKKWKRKRNVRNGFGKRSFVNEKIVINSQNLFNISHTLIDMHFIVRYIITF